MRYPLALAAALAAIALHADDEQPTVASQVAVAQCYNDCITRYAEQANRAILDPKHHNATQICAVYRNVIQGARACESGCLEVWTALRKPAAKGKARLDTLLDAEEIAYAAACTASASALDKGITMF